jgi:hypothetical protein
LFGISRLFAAPPLLLDTFEEGTSGWISIGESGAVRVARNAADVKNGSGALALDYTVGKGLSLAALPLEGKPVADMKVVAFWLKTDVPAGMAVVMNEKKPGGTYSAIVWSTGNTWQRVELVPADFHLNEGPNDPKDPDGKLDLDQLQGIGILDVSQVFGQSKTNLPIAIDSHAGKHSFYIDDFEISSEAPRRANDPSAIDSFETPQLQWMTLGSAELRPDGKGLRASYTQEEDHYVALVRQLPKVDLRGRERLAFDIASDHPAQLVISLEEHAPGKPQGPRYNVTVDVLGGGKMDHRAVLLSAFAPAEEGPRDENGKLDLDQLKTLTILDITAATSHETVKNSIWIGNIRGVGEARDR